MLALLFWSARSQRNLMRAMKRGLRRRVCLWRISVVPELRNERLLSARSDIRDRRLDGPILTHSRQSRRTALRRAE
jgi:hypothetical protein